MCVSPKPSSSPLPTKGNRDVARVLLERALLIFRTKLGDAHKQTKLALEVLEDLNEGEQVGKCCRKRGFSCIVQVCARFARSVLADVGSKQPTILAKVLWITLAHQHRLLTLAFILSDKS